MLRSIAKYLPMTIHVSWSVEGQILLKKTNLKKMEGEVEEGGP